MTPVRGIPRSDTSRQKVCLAVSDCFWRTTGRRDDALHDFILAAPSFVTALEDALAKTTNCHLIYQNSDFRLYSLSPTETY